MVIRYCIAVGAYPKYLSGGIESMKERQGVYNLSIMAIQWNV